MAMKTRFFRVTMLALILTLLLVVPTSAARDWPSVGCSGQNWGSQTYQISLTGCQVQWGHYKKDLQAAFSMEVCPSGTSCVRTDLVSQTITAGATGSYNFTSPTLTYTTSNCQVFMYLELRNDRGRVMASTYGGLYPTNCWVLPSYP
jgi:hypothetical protein